MARIGQHAGDAADAKPGIVVNNQDPLKNIRVVLARTSHPGNIGAAARAMKTMGLDDLALVQPRDFPHPEAAARARGGIDVVHGARRHASLASALGDCALAVAATSRHREVSHQVTDVRTAAREVVAAARAHRVAIVFGNEAAGLSGEEARQCQLWALIPADPGYGSLNLAAAVQVFAYELRMAALVPALPRPADEPHASLDQVEQLYQYMVGLMSQVGFYDANRPGQLLPRLRRLLARARLDVDEVNILRGFLKALDRARSNS